MLAVVVSTLLTIRLKIILLWHKKTFVLRMWHVSCVIRQDNLITIVLQEIKCRSFGGIFDEWPCPSVSSLNQVYQRLIAVNALDKAIGEQTRCRDIIPPRSPEWIIRTIVVRYNTQRKRDVQWSIDGGRAASSLDEAFDSIRATFRLVRRIRCSRGITQSIVPQLRLSPSCIYSVPSISRAACFDRSAHSLVYERA